MRVVVTGGAGYVGASLVPSLCRAPGVAEVVVYDNLSRREFGTFTQSLCDGKARFVEADILDGRSLHRVLDGSDVVIHLAAAVQVPTSDRDAHVFDQVNNWGSAQVATAIEDIESIRSAIYMSSAAVYGGGPDVFTVDSPTVPTSFYGVTKLRGEGHFTRLRARDRVVHVVRGGHVFGLNAATRFDSVVNRLTFSARFSRRVRIEGSGEQTRPFVHIGRLSEGITNLCLSDAPSGTHNFVDSTASVLDVASALRRIDPDVEMTFVDQDMQMEKLSVEPSPMWRSLAGDTPPPLDKAIGELFEDLRL